MADDCPVLTHHRWQHPSGRVREDEVRLTYAAGGNVTRGGAHLLVGEHWSEAHPARVHDMRREQDANVRQAVRPEELLESPSPAPRSDQRCPQRKKGER
jgi:hypothetical protein